MKSEIVREIECPCCQGSESIRGTDGRLMLCPTCHGSGMIEQFEKGGDVECQQTRNQKSGNHTSGNALKVPNGGMIRGVFSLIKSWFID